MIAGMSWSGFRPSDDTTKYGYNIPGNMYAVAALERAAQLNADVWQDAEFGRAASRLAATIRCGLCGTQTAMRAVHEHDVAAERLHQQLQGHQLSDCRITCLASFAHVGDGCVVVNGTACCCRAGIEKYGIVEDADGKKIYAYEVDGLGNVLSGFDDPNMPSLLGMPLLGHKHYDPQVDACFSHT